MQRTYVRRRRLAAALLLAAALVLGSPVARAFGGSSEAVDESPKHVVVPGETLWSIAERHAPGDDPRSVIHEIAELNDLGGETIVPGQTLSLPAGG